MQSKSRAVFDIQLHIVFVTKYRRKCLTDEVRLAAKKAFEDILGAWQCKLIEFGGEEDHVHLLVEVHPALDLSVLINNLKSASSKRLRNAFAVHLSTYYWKPVLWHRAYYVGSVGAVSLDKIREYVQKQGQEER